jgi:hypothetical protein
VSDECAWIGSDFIAELALGVVVVVVAKMSEELVLVDAAVAHETHAQISRIFPQCLFVELFRLQGL